MFIAAILKILRPTVQNCCNEEKDAAAKMSHMINRQSDTDCVSLLVTESKICYIRLIFYDSQINLLFINIKTFINSFCLLYT